jgi:parvulin-like peptidyl-prolyl isomerase
MKKFCVLTALVGVLSGGIASAQIAPAPEVPNDTVVVKIDGKNITAGDVRTALATLPPDFAKLYQQNPKNALEQLYVMRYMAQEAEKAKLDQQSPVKEQLELVRTNTLASAMLTYEHNHFPITEDMVKDYYEHNQAKYQQSKIKGIFVAFKPVIPTSGAAIEDVAKAASEIALGRTQRTEAEARTLAEDLVKQIRGGADLAKLATQYSDDPKSKAAGGDLGVVSITSPQTLDIKRAVMTLKAGDVTEPIRQFAGFYVIRVEDRTTQSMQEVYEPILQELRQAHVNEWFAGVRTKFAAQIEDPQFFARPTPGGPGMPAMPPMPPAPGASAK